MNPEQFARVQVVHELRKIISPDWMQMQYRDMPLPTPDHFWLHQTDMPLSARGELFSIWTGDKLIEFVPEIQYQRRGDWMDHFPPVCYRLTAKGRHVLDNPQEYVYAAGETDERTQS